TERSYPEISFFIPGDRRNAFVADSFQTAICGKIDKIARCSFPDTQSTFVIAGPDVVVLIFVDGHDVITANAARVTGTMDIPGKLIRVTLQPIQPTTICTHPYRPLIIFQHRQYITVTQA